MRIFKLMVRILMKGITKSNPATSYSADLITKVLLKAQSHTKALTQSKYAKCFTQESH